MTFLRILFAEILKLKRTLALWLVFLAPLFVVSMQFYFLYSNAEPHPAMNYWEKLIQNSSVLWASFMLPMFIILETALMNNLEHTARSWKQLFATPLSRWSIVTSKLVMIAGVVCASTLVLCVLGLIAGEILSIIRPELMMGGIPIGLLLKSAFLPFAASCLIIVFHNWVSIRWQGFVLSLGIGMAGVFFSLFGHSTKAGKYIPWTLPMNSLFDERLTAALLIGAVGGLALAVLAVWDIGRRDVE